MSDCFCPEFVEESTAHSTFFVHSLAGAAAGMAETAAMYPLDTIKTRMQATTVIQHGKDVAAIRAGISSLPGMLVRILREEGVRGLYKGLTAATAGAGPAHALYYAVYELTKKELGADRGGHQPFSVAAAGVAATLVNDAVMTPADVVKQRLQVSRGQDVSMPKCIARVWQEGGIAAFYRSYPATLLMNVPWTILHFPIYESSKKLLAPGREGREGTVVELAAGGLAGGVAAALTTPFDVVKTRLQLGSNSPLPARSAVNVFSVMRQITHEEGIRALWRGWQPRALWHAPAAAICWATYEAMKRSLGVNINHVPH